MFDLDAVGILRFEVIVVEKVILTFLQFPLIHKNLLRHNE